MLCDHPVHLFFDNKSPIIISHDLVQHDWTKHTEVDLTMHKKYEENITTYILYVPLVLFSSLSLTLSLSHSPTLIYAQAKSETQEIAPQDLIVYIRLCMKPWHKRLQ